ncbi:hypothetical protein HK096_006110 [Nowakowskiella sp. JEL0078]|nr:hypothetical protein HK096_006110 [Nowakowskiella sp. JEL0078]
MGTFDKDIQERYLLLLPQLYRFGIKGSAFNKWRFAGYMVEAIFQSIACFYISLGAYYEEVVHTNGRIIPRSAIGVVMAFSSILNANLFIAINTNNWTFFTLYAILASDAILFVWTICYTFIPNSSLEGLMVPIFATPTFYLTILMIVIVANLPRFLALFIIRMYCPSDVQLVQEVQKYNLDSELSEMVESCKRYKCEEKNAKLTIEKVSPTSAQFGIQNEIFENNRRMSSSHGFPRPSVSSIPMQLAQANTRISVISQGLSPLYSTFGLVSSRSSGHLSVHFHDDDSENPDEDERSQVLVLGRNSFWKSDLFSENSESQLAVLKTGKVIRNRGYSFSQSTGVRDVIMGRDHRATSTSSKVTRSKILKQQISTPVIQTSTKLTRNNTAPGRIGRKSASSKIGLLSDIELSDESLKKDSKESLLSND